MKLRKAISIMLCGLTLAVNTLSVCAADTKDIGTSITVKWPGEDQDASPAIQEAITAAEQAEGPVTIEFEPGKQYEVFPETAYHEMNYYVSNSATKSENPNGERWSAVFMKEMENITVEGNDAMINVHGVMTPILLDRCKDITFQNLHIDWERPTMSEFNIIEVGDNYAKVQVLEDSLFVLENDGRTLRWISEERPEGGYYWTLTGGLVAEHDPVANLTRRSSFPAPNRYIDEGDGVLRLEYSGRPNLKVGQNYQFRSGIRDQVGSFIHKCENIRFENMGFHYMHGLGIVAQYTKNISFDRLDCTPREETGRKCASFADFVQVSGCSGLVSVTNSKFSGAHDDVFNIHGTHLRIVDKNEAENKITVRFMHSQSWGFQAFDIGDEIEFVKPDTMLNYASNKVKDFKRLDDYRIELTLEEALPEGIALNADVVENITATPDVLLKGNYADNITTRGVLCTTRGEVVIEDNTFYKNGMSGLLLEDDVRAWYESGPIKNMTIRNNKFIECGGPQIFSNPQTSVYDPNKTVHSNIRIIGNEFTGYSTIRMLSTKNVLVEGNVFKDGGAIDLSACNGIAIGENENIGSVSVSNSLNEKSLDSFEVKSEETIETLEKSAMKATANNERSGYAASNLLDGKTNTIWHTDWENVPDEAYVEIDLGGSKTFNRISYLPRQDQTNGNIKGYELWVKERADGEYEKVAEGSWSGDSSEKQINLENSITAEAVKLVVTDSVYDSSNRMIASGAEIDFQNVSKNAIEIATGKKVSLSYAAVGQYGSPADLSEAVFTYSSDNEEVAVVDEKGIITGKSAGTAKITVTVNAYGKTLSSSAVITVTDEVYCGAENIEILNPQDGQMKVRVIPENAADDVTWSVERISGGTPAISAGGFLTCDGAGRMKVTAYSKNDPEIKDEMMVVATVVGETDQTFRWVKENPANWSVNENGGLDLKLDSGAIWSGTTNTVKNILLKETGSKDFTLVTKMNYKPDADYAEAGIAAYTDDDNYVFLSRKRHSGFGGFIFSVVTEVNGNPKESPAEIRVMDNVEEKDIYLKLEKQGNLYSGYYSEDGENWNAVWEDQNVDIGESPYAAIMGFSSKSEMAVFDYLQINGEQSDFRGLVPEMKIEKGVVTEIVTSLSGERAVGTAKEELNLPESLEVIWNGGYAESLPVAWDLTGYSEALTAGSYRYQGTISGVNEEYLEEGIKVEFSLGLKGESLAFDDVEEDAWFYDDVNYVSENGIMTGLTDTCFGPAEEATRAQFATILYRMAGCPEAEYQEKFGDVKEGEFYTDAVMWASANGIVTGYADTGLYEPDRKISREELSVMLWRYAKFCGQDVAADEDLSAYADGNSVSEFAKESMSWAVANHVIKGADGKLLNPQSSANRAECAAMIHRYREETAK